ncbi:MAG: outer membrane protein assembly factor BamE [Thermodesulfobacteriota bacterium]
MPKTLVIMTAMVLALLIGCAHLTTETCENAKKLKLGLSKDEARQVMGEPYKTEGYQAGEIQVESWYYLAGYGYYSALHTDFFILDFENDKLVGWGRQY